MQVAVGPDKPITVPYDPDFVVRIPNYYGVSLAAMAKPALEQGYRLVGANRYGLNAFFIHNDIGENVFPFGSVSHCLQHPFARHEAETRWPSVKDLPWVEV